MASRTLFLSALCCTCRAAFVGGIDMHRGRVGGVAQNGPRAAEAARPAVVAMNAAAAIQQPAGTHTAGAAGDGGRKKKIFVLGGDGFCGWPTALHLSDKGHEVVIIDNLSRRKIDVELGADSLTPITPPETRCDVWNAISGNEVRFVYLDLAKEYDRFVQMLKDEKPDTMVHFAEQRAAPYSQRNAATKRYTVDNNVGATHNVLCGIVESGLDIHLVHLGTMGVYGYGNSGGEIPEGYIDVTLPGNRQKTILHPAYPGSVYHTTKCLDALLFQVRPPAPPAPPRPAPLLPPAPPRSRAPRRRHGPRSCASPPSPPSLPLFSSTRRTICCA